MKVNQIENKLSGRQIAGLILVALANAAIFKAMLAYYHIQAVSESCNTLMAGAVMLILIGIDFLNDKRDTAEPEVTEVILRNEGRTGVMTPRCD